MLLVKANMGKMAEEYMSREVDEVIRHTQNILKSGGSSKSYYLEKPLNRESIRDLVEEVFKSVPICNYGIVRDLFEENKADSIIIWVDPKTSSFYKGNDSFNSYIPLKLMKDNGHVLFDDYDPNAGRLREKLNENSKAEAAFDRSINTIARLLKYKNNLTE